MGGPVALTSGKGHTVLWLDGASVLTELVHVSMLLAVKVLIHDYSKVTVYCYVCTCTPSIIITTDVIST